MARLLGPDMGSSVSFLPTGLPAAGKLGTVYANSAGTVLANILAYQPGNPTVPGAVIAGSVVTMDAYGMVPQFWFPDAVDIVWISVNNGPLVPINAGYDARIDALELLKAPKADPAFTGTAMFNRIVSVPVVLTDAPTIATDASLGIYFRVTLAGSPRVLGVPTNPIDTQRITWEVTQDVTGTRLLTLASGAGGFAFGTDVTAVTLSTAANAIDLIAAVYHATRNRWLVVAFGRGY